MERVLPTNPGVAGSSTKGWGCLTTRQHESRRSDKAAAANAPAVALGVRAAAGGDRRGDWRQEVA